MSWMKHLYKVTNLAHCRKAIVQKKASTIIVATKQKANDRNWKKVPVVSVVRKIDNHWLSLPSTMKKGTYVKPLRSLSISKLLQQGDEIIYE